MTKKKVTLILIGIFILIITINTISVVAEADWNIIKETYTTLEIIIELLNVIVSVTIGAMFNFLIPLVIVFAIFIGQKVHKKSKLSINDFNNYKQYYRDILYGYSPGVLSYIDNFELDKNNIISATLLALRLKNKITFKEENGIIEVNDTLDNLNKVDKYLLSKIEGGKLKDFYMEDFQNIILNEAKEQDLIKETILKKKDLIKIIGIIFIIMITLIVIGINLINNINFEPNPGDIEIYKMIALVAIVLTILFSPLIVLTSIRSYINQHIKNSYIRTKKGEDINEKLEGLKNYIQEFSNMHERNINDIMLWEEYLIYSVMFGQNKKISDEIIEKYTIIY